MKFKNLKKDIEIWLGTNEPPHDNCMWLKQQPDGKAVPMLLDEESDAWQIPPYFGITSARSYKCYDDMRGNTYKLSTGKFVKAEDLELVLSDLENLNLGLTINQYVEDNSQPGFRQLKNYPVDNYVPALAKKGLWSDVAEDIYCFAGARTSNAYKYNIASDSFTSLAEVTQRIAAGYSAYKEGIFYLLLGQTGDFETKFKNSLKYNISSNTYSSLSAQVAEGSSNGDFIQLDYDKVYIFGGGQNKVLVFNLATETWTETIEGVSSTDDVRVTPKYDNTDELLVAVSTNTSELIAKIFKISTSTFTTKVKSSIFSKRSARALFGNKSYFVGGNDSKDNYLDKVLSYNQETDEWKVEDTNSLLVFNANLGIQNGGSLYIPSCGSNSQAQKIFQVFTVQPNTFQIPAPTQPTLFTTLAAALEMVYKFGGVISDAASTITECFNPKSSTWSYKQSLSEANSKMESASDGFNIYLIGGLTNGKAGSESNKLIKYDSLNDVSTSLQALPKAVNSGGSTYHNGKVYSICGYDGKDEIADNLIYDIKTNAWTTGKSAPKDLTYTQAQEIDGKIYLFGGFESDGVTTAKDCFEYNPESDTWSTKSSMVYATASRASAKINGLIVSIGWLISGSEPKEFTNRTQVYNPKTDEWTLWSSLTKTFDEEIAACAANGSIYVVGATAHEALGPILNPVAWSPTHYVEGNAIGDYLLDDGRVLAADAYDEEEFKDHIAGIVIVPKSGESELIAMALDELSGTGTDYYFSNQQKLLLGQETDPNESDAVTQPPVSGSNPLLAFNQYKNSNAALREAIETGGIYPAYSYCKAYTAPGYAAGSWYLPNIIHLNLMYTNRTVLNQSLSRIGKTPLRTDDSFYWSCIQYDTVKEWHVYFGNNYSSNIFVHPSTKDYIEARFCTRPIIGVNGTGGGTDEPLPNSSVDPLLGEIGDYLLSNGTVLPGASYEEKHKSAIAGVIVTKKTASKEGIAMALTQLDGTGVNYYFSSERFQIPNQTTIAWQDPDGCTYATTPQKVASTNLMLAEAAQDYKKDNAAIKARRDSGGATYPAYTYCANHSAPGYPAGSWYLPSMKILYDMWQNRTALNQALSRIGATQLEPGDTHAWYWSCVQLNADGEWRVYFGSDYSSYYFFSNYYKDNTGYRCVSRPIVGF